MGIEIFGLVERVDAGPAEGVISEGFIQGVLLDFEVGPDGILHEVDLLGLDGLHLREDALEVVCVHFDHVVVAATDGDVLLSQRFGGLL